MHEEIFYFFATDGSCKASFNWLIVLGKLLSIGCFTMDFKRFLLVGGQFLVFFGRFEDAIGFSAFGGGLIYSFIIHLQAL